MNIQLICERLNTDAHSLHTHTHTAIHWIYVMTRFLGFFFNVWYWNWLSIGFDFLKMNKNETIDRSSENALMHFNWNTFSVVTHYHTMMANDDVQFFSNGIWTIPQNAYRWVAWIEVLIRKEKEERKRTKIDTDCL